MKPSYAYNREPALEGTQFLTYRDFNRLFEERISSYASGSITRECKEIRLNVNFSFYSVVFHQSKYIYIHKRHHSLSKMYSYLVFFLLNDYTKGH